METEAEFLKLLAERPHDRALRLVFSDWLLERGDPRGEFIALSYKEKLSHAELARLKKLRAKGEGAWLGPFAAVTETALNQWDGGFPNTLVFTHGLNERQIASFTGDERLCTVTRLVLPLDLPLPAWRAFLAHPVLAGLKELVANPTSWLLLAPGAVPFTLKTAGFSTWDVFDDDLIEACALPAARAAHRLELSTKNLLTPVWMPDFVRSVLSRVRGWKHFPEVRLNATYPVIEGVAEWLAVAARGPLLPPEWPEGKRWSAGFHGIRFHLDRDGRGDFSQLTLDLRSSDGYLGMRNRMTAVAALLVPLRGSVLKTIDVETGGASISRGELSLLRMRARRLRTIERLRVDGHAVDP